jgi:hypothetical protein
MRVLGACSAAGQQEQMGPQLPGEQQEEQQEQEQQQQGQQEGQG